MNPAIAAVGPYQGYSYGLEYGRSEEAIQVAGTWRAMIEGLSKVASFQPRLFAFRELRTVVTECCVDNWDGEGAAAISLETYKEAFNFLHLLPVSLKTPEVVAEPNGSIGFEWQHGRKVFVASVKGKQYISFAGLFGTGVRVDGTENFVSGIPASVITNLQRLREA